MKRHGFICAGCWTVDRIKMTDLWPVEEGLARIQSVDRHGGGSAHNAGIDLRRMDPAMPVSTIGVVGTDDEGDYLFGQALAHGIDTTQLVRSDALPTSYTDVITVSDTGKRTFFHFTGTNDLLTPEHFDFSQSSEKILHLGLLSLHQRMDERLSQNSNGWSQVLKAAKNQGLLTSIELVSGEASLNRELSNPCLPWLNFLVVNDLEIGALADRTTISDGQTNIDACIEAAKIILNRGSMSHVAVHFPEGALCIDRDQVLTVSASYDIPQSSIVGSVGAGDAFAAGFLYAMHEHWTTDDALELGHVVAAASLRSANTVESVDTISACRAFANAHTKRRFKQQH